MELQAWPGRIHLQIEGRGLGGLLLLRFQAGERGREGVGYTKLRDGLSSSSAIGLGPSHFGCCLTVLRRSWRDCLRLSNFPNAIWVKLI